LKRILASTNLDNDFSILKTILRDMYFKYMNKKNSKENIEIQKLLQAREENIDFETDFLEIFNLINREHYLGLSVEKIFQDLGYSSTQKFEELDIKKIHNFISNGLFRKKYYKNHIVEYKILMRDVTNYFEKFISNSLVAEDNIDLSTVLDMNINLELFFHKKANTKDKKLNELIEDAKNRFISNDKQIALEKLWDSYERLKTYFTTTTSESSKKQQQKDKPKSADKLVTIISDEFDKEFLNDEFKKLTIIGNDYRIRHHEKNKKELTSKHINYFFFRMLTLIDLCLMYLNEEEI
jgi:predicted hydrocarbon binding protein